MADSNMHVLIIPSWYFPPGSNEIAGRMFLHHAQALREEATDAGIMYISRGSKNSFFKKISWQTEEGVPTYRVSQWFPPKANAVLFNIWLKWCARDIRTYIRRHGRPDLIHAQSYMAACLCAELQKKTKIPFIYTERLSRFILHEIPKNHIPFLRLAFESASMITCVSPGLMDVLEPYSPKPVKVVPNFFDSRIFYTDPAVKKNTVFTYVSIGEPAQIKGLDILLQAFAALKKIFIDKEMQLILIDRIPEQEDLNKLAQSLQIAEHIHWTGLITQPEIADILRQSHVLVSASRVETFGKAMIEAQACGLPVVATKTDGATYILSSTSQGELAEINDANSLMKAMAKVYVGYEQYQPETIHQTVEKRFSQKKVIRQWINLYESLMG